MAMEKIILLRMEEKDNMEIKEVEWGVANNFGEYIEMHKDLKMYPELYKQILAHEIGHTQGFSKSDLFHDIKSKTPIDYKALSLFVLKRPKTWVDFFPIHYRPDKKAWVYDLNHLLLFTVGFSCLALIIWGGMWAWQNFL